MQLLLPKRMKFGPPRHKDGYIVFDNAKFFSIAELVLLGPTLLLCVVIAQIWPLYLMLGLQILGVVIGAVKFNHPTEQFQSLVLPTSTARAGMKPRPVNWKKAA